MTFASYQHLEITQDTVINALTYQSPQTKCLATPVRIFFNKSTIPFTEPFIRKVWIILGNPGVVHREGENSGPTQKSRAVLSTPGDIQVVLQN